MEVRFIFLHPPKVEEILFASPIIRSVVKQVEHAEVISAVPQGYEWLLEDNPYVSSLIVYENLPSKNIRKFRDAGADYLVDLSGERTAWFKNRLRVMDFSLKGKTRRQINSVESRTEAFGLFREEVFKLLEVFDLQDDNQGIDFLYGYNKPFIEKAVPESFIGTYAMLEMPGAYSDEIDVTGPLSELISRIERPIVLNGEKSWRQTGEEIMRLTGCTILSTCGDFSEKEQVFLRSGAEVLIYVEPGNEIWAMVFDKPHFYFDLDNNPDSWTEGVDEIRGLLKRKD